MSQISAIARMNIASLDDGALAGLRRFFEGVAEAGTSGGRELAAGYLAVIDDEIDLRRREP